MNRPPTFGFHVSRAARDRYRFQEDLFSWTGNVLFANVAASRRFAEQMNRQLGVERHPERTVHPGALNAMALIDEMLHLLVAQYRAQRDPRVMLDALGWFEQRLGRDALDKTLREFTSEFPPVEVYRGQTSAQQWLEASTGDTPQRAIALEELMMLWLANVNPAFRRFAELFDDKLLQERSAYKSITSDLKAYFQTRPRFGPEHQNLIDFLRAPALASPDSLEGQLAFMREKWPEIIGDLIRRILVALDIFKEEEIAIWMRFHPKEGRAAHFGNQQDRGDSSAAAIPHYNLKEPEYERFSADVDWMPRTVMIAKSAFVWLHQLSKAYARNIHRLDQVPDEELDKLARRGFNALWLIGLWQRSRASQRIKQLTGNPEAAASAYSLFDYEIADDLGGNDSYLALRERAGHRGVRMGSDMVPNHMGIDSRWVIEHPDWFISLPYSPFPVYRFEGPDLSTDGRVEIKIEDHYYDKTDAAVVFRRRDRWSGEARYVYHGNDGTSYPWNDTAQLNYLNPEVREAVIQKILHVARLSPIIRFDAAMTLAKQHYQRLWYPAPGTGGAIPSRAEHGLTKPEFDAAMPVEFWREVVDRVAVEAPGTLLLAEAFWLLEGYFVRTLGMHRVYNSAFMNMLRDEENANYRSVIKKTLEFDPEILKRYVNFMNNPDERTAVDQFGKGDKYFGVCTLLATLPGLPMFGHGQVEGFTERYGMEYRRAYHDESPDAWLVARHERQISPLLHRRALFAEVHDFRLYDFYTDSGFVNEDVFAYSNRSGNDRALVLFNNRFARADGWIRVSCAYSQKSHGGRSLRQSPLSETLCPDPSMFLAARETVTGLEYLFSGREVSQKGMHVQLGGYQCNVFLDWMALHDDANHPWGELCVQLQGTGVPSLSDAMRDLQLKPVHQTLAALLDPSSVEPLFESVGPEASREQVRKAEASAKSVVQSGAKSAKKRKLSADGDRASEQDASSLLALRLRTLLEAVQRFSRSEAAHELGVPAPEEWHGNVSDAVEDFTRTLKSASRIPALHDAFQRPWPEQACEVLPAPASPPQHLRQVWLTIVAWSAVRALGKLLDDKEADQSAARLFDALHLRQPLAAAFVASGMSDKDEAHWRAAARVRAVLANQAWLPGAAPSTRAPFSWLHDPDVAWLIDVHEYEGIRYFNKEKFECLLWWMALPALVRIAEMPIPDSSVIKDLEQEIAARIQAASDASYQVMALFEMANSRGAEIETRALQKQ